MANNKNKHSVFCPNCQQPAIKEGDQIICANCDGTYTFTKTGAAKVKQVGRIEQLEKDVAELKAQQSPGEPELEPEPGPEPEPEETDGTEEDW